MASDWCALASILLQEVCLYLPMSSLINLMTICHIWSDIVVHNSRCWSEIFAVMKIQQNTNARCGIALSHITDISVFSSMLDNITDRHSHQRKLLISSRAKFMCFSSTSITTRPAGRIYEVKRLHLTVTGIIDDVNIQLFIPLMPIRFAALRILSISAPNRIGLDMKILRFCPLVEVLSIDDPIADTAYTHIAGLLPNLIILSIKTGKDTTNHALSSLVRDHGSSCPTNTCLACRLMHLQWIHKCNSEREVAELSTLLCHFRSLTSLNVMVSGWNDAALAQIQLGMPSLCGFTFRQLRKSHFSNRVFQQFLMSFECLEHLGLCEMSPRTELITPTLLVELFNKVQHQLQFLALHYHLLRAGTQIVIVDGKEEEKWISLFPTYPMSLFVILQRLRRISMSGVNLMKESGVDEHERDAWMNLKQHMPLLRGVTFFRCVIDTSLLSPALMDDYDFRGGYFLYAISEQLIDSSVISQYPNSLHHRPVLVQSILNLDRYYPKHPPRWIETIVLEILLELHTAALQKRISPAYECFM